jgi:RimJ/RimL family protein N-acetyltransferase
MHGSNLRLRPARRTDADRLRLWRNDPETRARSFSRQEISEAEHLGWLERKLADPACLLLIVEENGTPVGQVRLDRVSAGEAEVSIGLAPSARGRGIGRRALGLAAGEGARALGVARLRAEIQEDNQASLHAFAAAGFGEAARSRGVVTLTRSTL